MTTLAILASAACGFVLGAWGAIVVHAQDTGGHSCGACEDMGRTAWWR